MDGLKALLVRMRGWSKGIIGEEELMVQRYHRASMVGHQNAPSKHVGDDERVGQRHLWGG